jgi:small subunit ribosomal protein S16
MVKIRLMRMGKRKQPYYRVVVADARSPRDGRFIENIGRYHPRAHPSVIEIDSDRALHWLRTGAQPSDPVRVLFQKTGIWGQFTGQGPTEAVAPPPEKPPKPKTASPSDATEAVEAPADGVAAPEETAPDTGQDEAASEKANATSPDESEASTEERGAASQEADSADQPDPGSSDSADQPDPGSPPADEQA